MLCQACERGDHDNCGMQTWCTCECEGYNGQLVRLTPPCRVCGKTGEVICYPEDHSQTICPDCCKKAEHADGEDGHVWVYSKSERGDECKHCGIPKCDTDYDFTDYHG